MFARSSGPGRNPAAIALCGLLAAVLLAVVFAATAHASDYRMVLCAANNGSNSYGTSTNTTSPQNPSGIFSFQNNCGPAPFPADGHAYLHIEETQPSGNAGQGAYGNIYYDSPPFIHFREASGFTRQNATFNEGWCSPFGLSGARRAAGRSCPRV